MANKIDPKRVKLYESALIKSIRRGLVDDAVHWASVLHRLDRAEIVWRRLTIHLSEDVGLADRNLPANVAALRANFEILSRQCPWTAYEGDRSERLPLIHAVMLVASAPKSRAVDHALIVHYLDDGVREVPDYCIDYHSPKGRRMGRGVDHFFEEAGLIADETQEFEDVWREKARALLKSRE